MKLRSVRRIAAVALFTAGSAAMAGCFPGGGEGPDCGQEQARYAQALEQFQKNPNNGTAQALSNAREALHECRFGGTS